MRIAYAIIALCLFVNIKSYAQTNDFKDVLDYPVVGLKIIGGDSSISFEKTFLGTIKNSKNEIIFYLIKEYYTFQAVIEKHGHSRLLLFDKEKKLLSTYDLNSPEELPYQLKNNILYFKYEDENSHQEKIHGDTIGVSIPKYICVEPNNDCYFPE